ncbi:hypothetical protein PG985_015502 [Apiospora marii]|uniref:AMP-activated protein kinase glycogen-binding domain-containing protein n=1 Tax=Apiospora marii TaxID=335849 RepID=A0ABR1S6J9_9PEZI
MATVQLSFSLRVSSGVKSVHLLGSWDNYVGQLPLSKDKTSSKSGSWKGTFRFQGNLEAGQRYWYYYIIDGYHVSHNPSEKSTVEPTTGRELNILDVPKDKSHKSSSSSSSKSHSSSSSSSKSSSRHSSSSSSSKDSKHRSSKRGSLTVDIPKGRPLSTSQIKAPKPITPHATRHILDVDYCDEDIEELTARFGSADIDEDVITDFSSSPVSSNGSSLSYRSDSSSPNSSLSGYSTPSSDCSNCTCERYGITRKGDRVKIDCGGARCGFSDDDSACSSSGDEEEYVSRSSRRNGIVVRS